MYRNYIILQINGKDIGVEHMQIPMNRGLEFEHHFCQDEYFLSFNGI